MKCQPEIDTEYVRDKLAMLFRVPDECFDVNSSMHVNPNKDEIVVRAMFKGLSHAEEEVWIPVDWWQAFKLRFFPAWMSRFSLPRMQRIETRRFCPHLLETIRDIDTSQISFDPDTSLRLPNPEPLIIDGPHWPWHFPKERP